MHTDFINSRHLLDAAKWVTDFDPSVEQGSPRRHILLEQVEGEKALLSGWSMQGTCLQRHVSCTGQIGNSYLIDGEDLQQRCSNNIGWRDVAVRLVRGKGNFLTLHSIKRILPDGTFEGYGKVNIPTYPGLVGEFHKQEILDNIAAVVSSEDLLKIARRANAFSKLRTDKCERHALLRIVPASELFDERLEAYSAEPNGNSGFAHLYQECSLRACHQDIEEEVSICIYGRYINHIADVASSGQSIEIRVDNLEEPKRVQFVGDKGIVTTAVDVDPYRIKYLAQTGVYNFKGNPKVVSELKSQRVFDCSNLLKVVDTQRPKKTATRLDLKLEQEGMGLIVSKAGDPGRVELSKIEHNSDISMLDDDWIAMTVNYKYLIESLKLCKVSIDQSRHETFELHQSEGDSGFASSSTDFFVDEDFENEEYSVDIDTEEDQDLASSSITENILLEQIAIGLNTDRVLLRIRPCSVAGVELSINCLTYKEVGEEEDL